MPFSFSEIIITGILFFLFTPNLLFNFDGKLNKYLVVIIHALLFGLIVYLMLTNQTIEGASTIKATSSRNASGKNAGSMSGLATFGIITAVFAGIILCLFIYGYIVEKYNMYKLEPYVKAAPISLPKALPSTIVPVKTTPSPIATPSPSPVKTTPSPIATSPSPVKSTPSPVKTSPKSPIKNV